MVAVYQKTVAVMNFSFSATVLKRMLMMHPFVVWTSLLSGWWIGTLCTFSIHWEYWSQVTHISQRGRVQPPTSIEVCFSLCSVGIFRRILTLRGDMVELLAVARWTWCGVKWMSWVEVVALGGAVASWQVVILDKQLYIYPLYNWVMIVFLSTYKLGHPSK